MSIENFKNPWAKGGEYYPDWFGGEKVLESSLIKILGGEVTNDSDISWLISGGSNSDAKDFIWLPPNTNSDHLPEVKNRLKGDVDAVWPPGKSLKIHVLVK